MKKSLVEGQLKCNGSSALPILTADNQYISFMMRLAFFTIFIIITASTGFHLFFALPTHDLKIQTVQLNNEPPEDGKKLFHAYCSPCHQPHKAVVGPALARVHLKYKRDELITYIRTAHPNKPYPDLTKQQAESIIDYLKSSGPTAPGSGSAGNAGSQSAAAVLSAMETRLKTTFLNGDQDHDYLVQMMVLNYQATKRMASDEVKVDNYSQVLSTQQGLFNQASALLKNLDPGKEESRFPVTMKTEEEKTVRHLQLEMKMKSMKIAASSDNPVIVEFAEKAIQQIERTQ